MANEKKLANPSEEEISERPPDLGLGPQLLSSAKDEKLVLSHEEEKVREESNIDAQKCIDQFDLFQVQIGDIILDN